MTRRTATLVLLAAAVVVAAYLTAAQRTTGPAFDPRSTAPDGTAGLVEVVDALGGDVEILEGVPDAGVDTAVLLQDRYDRDDAARLDAWVRAGGTLVVADPASALTPPRSGAGRVDEVGVACAGTLAPVLGAVERLELGFASGFAADAVGVDGTCTDVASGQAVVVATPTGAGTVVAVSGRQLFTNRLLDEADNAVVAANLLVPTPGLDVAFLAPRSIAGTGDRSLVDLVDTPVRAALAQLAVAFVFVVAWRSRRLGRPVPEPQPVAIEGSELTRAVGRLLAGNGRPEHAAGVLRDRFARDVGARLGLPPDADPDQVADVVAATTSLTPDAARRAITAPVTDDDDLVAVATTLTRLRQEVIHGRPADAP